MPVEVAPKIKVLWVDDEIDLLKSHIVFLKQKDILVTPLTNGEDALDLVQTEDFDLVFLDENMPGLNGLDTLLQLKNLKPLMPVVMITKSEEERVMETAIGSKIADYLIKPVNPNQILSSVKKIVQGQQLVNRQVNSNYQRSFSELSMALMDSPNADEWQDLYRRLVYWELELDHTTGGSMQEVFQAQKTEANVNFCKYVGKNYLNWVNAGAADRPVMSPDVLERKVLPYLKKGEPPVFLFLVDCLRFDQWKMFEQVLADDFQVVLDDMYYSILPTSTQYARNALFAGLWPDQIAERFPQHWVHDDESTGKNLHEEEFLKAFLKRKNLNIRHQYHKLLTVEAGRQYVETIRNGLHNDLNVVVINFIDLLTHARSEMNIVKELAPDEAALRSITKSWIRHSSFLEMLRALKGTPARIIITTDHGSVRVKRPVRIIADRDTTTNLRYKHGRNLNYDEKTRQVLTVRRPAEARLPKSTVSGTYAFATEDNFFVYPNNYNQYVNLFKDTFQHGGLSLEEVLIPFVVLESR
jgi:DNA-binding NarL/FixJ family response regulator